MVAKYKSRATDVARVASQKRRAVKEEAARFRSQLEKVKSSWGPPKDMQKLKKQLDEAHATSKMLRLDLARKAKRLDALEKTAKQEKKDEADAVQKLERLQSRVRRAEAEARRRRYRPDHAVHVPRSPQAGGWTAAPLSLLRTPPSAPYRGGALPLWGLCALHAPWAL